MMKSRSVHCLVVGLLGWFSALHAQGLTADEYKLKAAFLYNFTQYVEWPATAFATASAPFVVCVAGTNPFGEHLKALESRSYKTHAIAVAFPKTIAEARNCHILYSDDLRGTSFGREPWKTLADSPLLTVSSTTEASDSGVGIGFVIQSGRLRWALNLAATRQAQLKVSSKLIEIAASVTGDTR
jgi:hypothetical protein